METINNNTETKRCSKCKADKEISEFYINKVQCKVCCQRYTNQSLKKRGVLKGKHKKWKPEEIEYLKENYSTADLGKMAAYFNTTGVNCFGEPHTTCAISDIRQKAQHLGLPGERRNNYLQKCANNQAAKKTIAQTKKIARTKRVKPKASKQRKIDNKKREDRIQQVKNSHEKYKLESAKKKHLQNNRYKTKVVDPSSLMPVRIDQKTVIYLPTSMDKATRESYIEMYRSKRAS